MGHYQFLSKSGKLAEIDDSIMHQIEELGHIARQLPCNRNSLLVEDTMAKTLPERRVLVKQADKMKTIPELKALCPLLFTASAIANEYKMLMNNEPLQKFYGALETIEEKVFSFTSKQKNQTW